MGGFMKKIGVIIRTPPRDFSPMKVAIHPFVINGKIVKCSCREKKISSNVSQKFYVCKSNFIFGHQNKFPINDIAIELY